jgi:glycosyltransferase involved in cell wall biosynthesis
MVIGIDASRYGHAEATGVEWYSYHLLNELIPMLGRDHNSEVRLYSPQDFKPAVELPFNVKKRIIPAKRLWTVLRLSLELLLHPVDRLFVPSHTLPIVLPKKSIITIHDVAFAKMKESYDEFQYRLLMHSTKRAVKKAWRIIVPSEATKKDLIDLFKCREKKIVVIPHGAPTPPKLRHWSTAEKSHLLNRFGLKDNDLFVFYVGRLETKKNLSRLVEGFARLLKEFPDWKLVMAGKRGVGFEKIWKTVEAMGLEKSVIMPGYVTEREKMFLMDKCRVFAFPSLYEGFGLPVLEGFAHRRPVLTSKVSSMPEVAGNAAFLVNPEKVEEIGVGLKRLASDGMLVSQLILKGEARLAQYSWEKAAKETFEVLFEGVI